MHYLIQENLFRENHHELLLYSLDRLGLTYDLVRIFPYVDKIVEASIIPSEPYVLDVLPDIDVTAHEKVFVFGAVKLGRVASERAWKPGSMMNANHDFNVYSRYYRENLLNYDSEIVPLSHPIQWAPGEDKFIRPCEDTKSFAGQLFNSYEWEDKKENYLHNYRSERFNENTLIQVSTPKKIHKEIRFWVVGGKIVTGSQYRLGNSVIYDPYYEEAAKEFAQRMVDLYQIAEAFVIDVCLLDGGVWKIVEVGCINCAGFYRSDVQRTIIALEEYFNIDKNG